MNRYRKALQGHIENIFMQRNHVLNNTSTELVEKEISPDVSSRKQR